MVAKEPGSWLPRALVGECKHLAMKYINIQANSRASKLLTGKQSAGCGKTGECKEGPRRAVVVRSWNFKWSARGVFTVISDNVPPLQRKHTRVYGPKLASHL